MIVARAVLARSTPQETFTPHTELPTGRVPLMDQPGGTRQVGYCDEFAVVDGDLVATVHVDSEDPDVLVAAELLAGLNISIEGGKHG